MVVISGETMKDKNSPGEAASACKGQAEQNLEQSNYTSSDCGVKCSASPDQQFPQTSDAEVDLYDDIEPKESLGSNGQNSQQCSTEPIRPSEEYVPDNHEQKVMEDINAGAVKKPAMSEAFSQLVSDTLNDPEVDGAMGPSDAAAEFCSIQSFSSISNTELPLPSEANGTSCNGNEAADTLQYQQAEIVFNATTMDSCSINPITHVPSRFESEVHDDDEDDVDDEEEEDEDGEESDGSAEFNEEDCKAAIEKHRKKAAMTRQKKDQSGDSSIMVLDSDEEGDCDDEMDGEEELEEEEMLEEEEEEADPEDYEGEEQGLDESQYSSDQSFRSTEKSKQPYSAYGTAAPPQQMSESSSMKVTGQKQSHALNGQQMILNGRDHESVMKKIRFNQEMSMMRRTESQNVTEEVKGVEDFNEEDGWQELVKWNEMREEEKALGTKDNNAVTDHSRLPGPEFKQGSGKELPALIKRTENFGNREPRNISKTAVCESISSVPHSLISESTNTKPDSHTQAEFGRQESRAVSSTHFSGTQENEPSQKLEMEHSAAPASAKAGTNLPSPIVAQLNETKGYFEIGSCRGDPSIAMYNLSTTIIFVKQLSKIIPGALLRSCKEGPHFEYSLLGCPVHTDPIASLSECEFPGERANARVMATASNFALYLQQHSTLTVMLLIGEIELAQCSIDLLPLVQEGSQTKSKVEGSYNLIPVKGNILGAASAGNAVLGVSVTLERTSEPCSSSLNNSTSSPALNDTEKRLKKVMSHLSEVSVEYESLNKKRNKRERESSVGSDQGNMEASEVREDSLAMSATRQLVREHLKPPMKKRKLTEFNDEKSNTSEHQAKVSDNWTAAEEDLQQWRQAQENIFWKQWMVREKKLQDSLSKEWKERMVGLEEDLMEQLQQVEQERAALESEWRSLRERETSVRRREEQLLQLQQEVLEQQAALGSQLQRGCRNTRPVEPLERLRPITSGQEIGHVDFTSGSSSSSSKEFYKRQWLRGIATTHRRWAHGPASAPSISSAGALPSASGCGTGVSSEPRSADKYDSEIFDELTRVTKERRRLLTTHAPDSPQVQQLDSALERLMAASGV